MPFLRWIFRLVEGLVSFSCIALAWGFLLMQFWPWEAVSPDGWSPGYQLLITDRAGQTKAITYQEYLDSVSYGQSMVVQPATESGEIQIDQPSQGNKNKLTWTTMTSKPWQYELSYDERDYLYQIRYRVEGGKPLLIQTRIRGPQIGILVIPLALMSVIIWRVVCWFRKRINRAG